MKKIFLFSFVLSTSVFATVPKEVTNAITAFGTDAITIGVSIIGIVASIAVVKFAISSIRANSR
jgi:hypothetical protein